MRSAAPASIQVSLIGAILLVLSRPGAAQRRTARTVAAVRQFAPHVISRILQLARQRRDDLAIGGEGARKGLRTVRLDRLMQLRQRVIGDHREHVMLDVVVHFQERNRKNGFM